MRKLKLQVQMSVDGRIARTDGVLDFLVWQWDEALEQYVDDLTGPVDCIVLGRKLAEGFIPHWANVAANPDDPQAASGRKFTDTPKVVFSETLAESPWDNTVVARSLVDEISRLKQQDGQDIIAYGGGTFVSALIREGLIDEYHLFVNPIALGRGMTIFEGLEDDLPLTLVEAIPFACGIVVLHYQPKGG